MHKDVLKWIIIGIIGFAVLIFVFGAGIFVGTMKAKFSYRWAESYHKNFAGPQEGFFGDWRKTPPFPGDFIEGHGTFGEIIKIDSSDFVVQARNNTETIIVITEDTVITEGRKTIKKSELKIGDYIVTIGSPNEKGQIEARLIRLLPPSSKKESLKQRSCALIHSNFPFLLTMEPA